MLVAITTSSSRIGFNIASYTSAAYNYLFNKSSNTPLYIHANSNHPSSIVKKLPKMVKKRISGLFCDDSAFNNAKVIYESVLKHSRCENQN